MPWPEIKTALLAQHAHAFAHGTDEVRLVLAFAGDARVTIVVRCAGDHAAVIAEITRDAAQMQALRRAAVGSTVPLVMIGDALYLRVAIADDRVEELLQATARAALRLRHFNPVPADVAATAFAFAL